MLLHLLQHINHITISAFCQTLFCRFSRENIHFSIIFCLYFSVLLYIIEIDYYNIDYLIKYGQLYVKATFCCFIIYFLIKLV